MRAKPSTKLTGDAAVASHAWKRIDRMTMMGLTVPKLIAVAKVTGEIKLGCQAATYQAGRGSNQERTQAAHNLPRDLMLNGRPVWTYAAEDALLDTHARVKLQINYSSAATMNVKREANYIDSRWEETRLVDDWIRFLYACIANARQLGTSAPLDNNIRTAAVLFRECCKSTLNETVDRIVDSDYYDAHAEALESYFVLYREKLDQYDPVGRLDRMWSIYQLPQYR